MPEAPKFSELHSISNLITYAGLALGVGIAAVSAIKSEVIPGIGVLAFLLTAAILNILVFKLTKSVADRRKRKIARILLFVILVAGSCWGSYFFVPVKTTSLYFETSTWQLTRETISSPTQIVQFAVVPKSVEASGIQSAQITASYYAKKFHSTWTVAGRGKPVLMLLNCHDNLKQGDAEEVVKCTVRNLSSLPIDSFRLEFQPLLLKRSGFVTDRRGGASSHIIDRQRVPATFVCHSRIEAGAGDRSEFVFYVDPGRMGLILGWPTRAYVTVGGKEVLANISHPAERVPGI